MLQAVKMAFETNKEPKLDVMQPDLDDIDPDSVDIVPLNLDHLLYRIEKIEEFLVDFGWE